MIPTVSRWKRWSWPCMGCLSAYGVMLVVLMLLERSLIYPAPRADAGQWLPPSGFEPRDHWLTSSDGTQIHGWLFERPAPRGFLLFCHGNAENVSYAGRAMDQLSRDLNVTILAFDYRGYGRSQGKPDEAGVLADGEAALEWLSREAGPPPREMLLLGRSLGGAVAVHLAAKYQVRGLILQSSFSRLTDVAASHYPFFPVRSLMRNRYDSVAKIQQYKNPLLQIHGDRDSIVPFRFGQLLFQAAASPDKQLIRLPGREHNDIDVEDYTPDLQRFVDRVVKPSAGDSR